MGFGKSFYKLDNDFIRRFVDTPWTLFAGVTIMDDFNGVFLKALSL